MIVFLKSHPAVQGMSAARAPVDLNEPSLRRSPGEPDAGQSASGKYRKPRVEWQGLTIAIENPAGSVRRGRNRDGVSWEQRMQYAYGEILGSMGVDGDPVDVFLGPNMDAPMVYVVHQRKVNRWDEYDEDKCMVGFDSEDEAKAAFLACYTDPRFLGPVTALPVAEFIAKVRATRDAPAMIKAVLFFKAHVGPYLRGGKVVNLAGYQGRPSRAVASPGQMSLFGGPSSGQPLPPSPLQGKDAVAHTPDLFADEPQHIENMHGLDANKRLPDHNPASHGDSHNYGSNVVAKKPAGSWAYTNEHGKHHVLFSTGAGKYSSTDMLDSREAAFKQAKERMKARGLIDETQHTEPTRELIAEHERLVDVLNSPSHADDKAEAKKQAAELSEMKQEASEHDHLLADIPGAKWRRGKGHIAGQYGVEVDGNVLGGYHAKPEDAVADYKQRAATRAQWAEDEARHTAAVGNLRERLLSGGEPTDSDLKLLGLKDGSSGLKWFIPAAAKVFGITSHAVRPHIKDMIRIGHSDMGTKLEFVSPKKALQAIAAGLAPKPAYTPATDDDHPAPMPRSLMRGVPEDKLDEWKDLHRQQHELHHYELGQVREKLERHRGKRNKAQTALRESEAAVASLRGAPVRDPAREAEAQKMVDKHHAEFTKLTREQDALVGHHQTIYEKIAKLGRAKDKILDGSGDMERDFASMAKRTASEQQDHEKSMLKMYREHYKAKDAERKRKPAPMIKSITILRSPQAS